MVELQSTLKVLGETRGKHETRYDRILQANPDYTPSETYWANPDLLPLDPLDKEEPPKAILKPRPAEKGCRRH
jgi:hypothetical protein